MVGFCWGVDGKVFLLVVTATGSKSSPASKADRLVTFDSFDLM